MASAEAGSSGPTSPAPAPAPAPARAPPPGFKFIKVKKPDGTIVTVKKKLTPEELEKQQQAQPSPQAEAPKTASAAPTEATGKKDGVQYKIITVRMPDGTLAKVKRPADADTTTKKPTGSAARASTPANLKTDATGAKDTASPRVDSPAEAEQPPTADQQEALREQALAHKHQRRARFGTALLFGLVGAGTAVLPDLLDGDEIMSDTDFSDDDGDFFDDDGDNGPGHIEGEETSGGAASNLAPGIAAGAATAAAGVAVAALAGPPAQPPPARQMPGAAAQPGVAGAPQTNGKANGKEAYKVTVNDLKALDEKAEAEEKPLERRWAAFSFYLLASLSIVLPALFLVLGCFIIAMNGKSIESDWGKMIDPIKIAVTVWPIVFAAVTAQAFKTWAAYKVERGVKLMELEQLIGSNSFGAVMKQPFVLRRLDILTLGIFLVWALSPIGSQALLRAYTLERDYVEDTVPVKYVPMLGRNLLLSPDSDEYMELNGLVAADLWQAVSSYYIAAFVPNGVKRAYDQLAVEQDMYNHPVPQYAGMEQGHVHPMSFYGVPIALPEGAVEKARSDAMAKMDSEKLDTAVKRASADAAAPFENITFPVTSSFFKLACLDPETRSRSAMQDTFAFSHSETLAIEMTGNHPDRGIEHVSFGTLLEASKHLERTNMERPEVVPSGNWSYAVFPCDITQVFYNSNVSCFIDAVSGSFSFDCQMGPLAIVPDDQAKPEWRTKLEDFSNVFAAGGSPYPLLYPATPTEVYTFTQNGIDKIVASDLDGSMQSKEGIALFFGKLLNTFITLTHCPHCVATSRLSEILQDEADASTKIFYDDFTRLYQAPATPAQHVFSPDYLVYKLAWPWVAVFVASVVILLLVGLASVFLESVLVAPDVLGYASTLARNSRYLHLPKTAAKPMSGPERARAIGGVRVMIQDVKPEREVGKIALGLKHDRAEKLKAGRLYR